MNGQDEEIDEELEELDECHDGEAEPQTKHSTRVCDVLQQLTTTITNITSDKPTANIRQPTITIFALQQYRRVTDDRH